MTKFNTIKQAVSDIKNGKLVVVLDDKNRENEGDLVCAAQKITPEIVNFMVKYGRGLICVPLDKKTAKRLDLDLMVKSNTENTKCKFTVTVDYKFKTTTGISAYDRARTIKGICNKSSKPGDFMRPGHVFPIITENDGVLKRAGHSEASVDLCKLALLKPIAVICEILNDNGKMARKKDLFLFIKRHKLKIITINDLRKYLNRADLLNKK